MRRVANVDINEYINSRDDYTAYVIFVEEYRTNMR